MKNLILSLATLITITACGQADKSQRPSPPAVATETLDNGTVVTIDYSQPSVKGRKVGTELAPYGKVWRTGANEITVFEISKDAKVEGQSLAAGKYGLFSIPGEAEWVIILSKTSKGWGTQYKEADDAIRMQKKQCCLHCLLMNVFAVDLPLMKINLIIIRWVKAETAFPM